MASGARSSRSTPSPSGSNDADRISRSGGSRLGVLGLVRGAPLGRRGAVGGRVGSGARLRPRRRPSSCPASVVVVAEAVPDEGAREQREAERDDREPARDARVAPGARRHRVVLVQVARLRGPGLRWHARDAAGLPGVEVVVPGVVVVVIGSSSARGRRRDRARPPRARAGGEGNGVVLAGLVLVVLERRQDGLELHAHEARVRGPLLGALLQAAGDQRGERGGDARGDVADERHRGAHVLLGDVRRSRRRV